MDYKKTQLSVIIPTVNAVSELDLAIKSILQNSDCQIELIVVVDPDQKTGKIDQKIVDVCKKYDVVYSLNQSNLGPYGNWNKGAELSKSDWLIFATDDQYFAPHWDSNLLKVWQPKRLVAGRLVEPGIIPVYKTNIQESFGLTPDEFDEEGFLAWCQKRPQTGFAKGGFFIPLLQSRKDFEALGHYETGGRFGTSDAKSNDYQYIENALSRGYTFGTSQDSYSYHFQASSWKKKTLKPKIAAVVLTRNEERDLPSCLASLHWVDQVIVVDSLSTDKTKDIAKKAGAKVYAHTLVDFASQRNYALSKAVDYDWVLMIDADEVVEEALASELLSFAKDIYLDGVQLPRKNYIFGKWIEHSDWYPDLRLVFFRPKLVEYRGQVHERIEFVKGNGAVSTANSALIHRNYDTVSEFVQKNLVSYPEHYAKALAEQKVQFAPVDLLTKPIAEFMRRFFLASGYKDGIYGLILALLMSAQTLVAYIYLWELQGKNSDLSVDNLGNLFDQLKGKGAELSFWLSTVSIENTRGATKLLHRAKRKALKVIKGL